jgi:hypothetical protein
MADHACSEVLVGTDEQHVAVGRDVRHHIPSAQQVADYVGLLFRLTDGPFGMSEERDRPELL